MKAKLVFVLSHHIEEKNWLTNFLGFSLHFLQFVLTFIDISLILFFSFSFFSDGRDTHTNARSHHTVCNRTWFGDVGKTYEMELDKPTVLPFICHLNFTAPGGSHGDIIQVSNGNVTQKSRFG